MESIATVQPIISRPMFSVSPARFCASNSTNMQAANGTISKHSLCFTSRHHIRSRRIIRRAKARGSCQELPPHQQARHEVQRGNAEDERRSRNICTFSILLDADMLGCADHFVESDGGWSGLQRRGGDVFAVGATALLLLVVQSNEDALRRLTYFLSHSI